MLTYSFSRREKAMLVGLALVLVAVVWYQLVFVGTQDQISQIESEIASVQDEIVVDTARAQQLRQMRNSIEQYKAAGVRPSPLPAYDNVSPLMAELNARLAQTGEYSLAFDAVEVGEGSVARRGVTMTYGAATYEEARSVALGLVDEGYPCSIDELTITDNTAALSSRTRAVAGNSSTSQPFSVAVHLTFYEQITGAVRTNAQGEGGSTDAAIAVGESLGMVNAPSGAGAKVLTDGAATSGR